LSQLDTTYSIDGTNYGTDYQYLHSWTQQLLFSETSSEVKNNRLQWTSPLCGLDGCIDRGACAKNIRSEK
jgi:hypothetical protein